MRGLRFLAFLGCVSTLLSLIPAEACLVVPAPPAPPSPPRPILINGDSEFPGNPFVAGGSGTHADPYRIENLVISVLGQAGICVINTNASFVIRNVTVTYTEPTGGYSSNCGKSGFSFANVKNASIVDSVVRESPGGVSLTMARDVSVVNTTVQGGDVGIEIDDSTNVTLRGNHVTNATISLEEQFWRFSRLGAGASSYHIGEDNLVDGLPFVFRANCASTTISDRIVGGVAFAKCTGLVLRNVTVPGRHGSLAIYDSSNVELDQVRSSTMILRRVSSATLRRAEISALEAYDFSNLRIEGSRSPAGEQTRITTQNGTGLRIEGNDFVGDYRPILQLGEFPAYRCSCQPAPPRTPVEDAFLINNTFREGWPAAVEINDAPGAGILNNTFVNGSRGIDGGSTPQVLIEGNLFVGPTYGGSEAAITSSGEGSWILNNTIRGFNAGLDLGPGVEARGNHIEASRAGITLTEEGGPNVSGNQLLGGAIVPRWRHDSIPFSFAVGPNNTLNGLPVAFHHGCSDLRYEGVALGQLVVVNCENVTLTNLSFRDVSLPVLMVGIANLSIENLEVENASLGIDLRGIWGGRMAHSRLNNTSGVDLMGALNMTFEANALTNGTAGFRVSASAGLEFLGNRVESFGQAPLALLYQASDLKLRGNEFVGGGLDFYGSAGEEVGFYDIDGSNTVDGEPLMYVRDLVGSSIENLTLGELIMANCTGTRVANLQIRSSGPGIILAFVADIVLSNLTVNSSRGTAFAGWYVEGLTLEDSTITTGSPPPSSYAYGAGALTFVNAVNVTIERTNATGSGYYPGLEVISGSQLRVKGGSFRGGWSGAALYTLTTVQVVGAQFWGTSCGLAADSLVNATITNSSFGGGGGLCLDGLRDSTVEGNDLSSASSVALGIRDSSRVGLASNRMHNSAVGMSLQGSLEGVTVERNTLVANGQGIYVNLFAGLQAPVSNVSIVNNTIEGNDVGVRGNASAGVQVYHNRFLNNTVQAQVSPGALWDAGYLVGGNYWSNYRGTDACSGPNQDVCPDPDEFGDAPYCLGAPVGVSEAVDRYPLKNQTPPPPRDPPPFVAPPPPLPVPGVLDPTIAGLSGIALALGVAAAAVFLTSRRRPPGGATENEGEDQS